MELPASQLKVCPKCSAELSARRSVLYDKVNDYQEFRVSCRRCEFVGSEIYDQGRLVKCVDATPMPKAKPIPYKVVKKCPFCGKYCDAQTGFRHDFDGSEFGFRVRQYAHPNCSRQSGISGPTPFGPFPFGSSVG